MEIDLNNAVVVVIACVVLCGVGVLLLFGLQIIGTLIGTVMSFFDIFLGILAGGPVAWCGCGLLLVACLLCSGVAVFLATAIPNCATNPIMFCRFFGY